MADTHERSTPRVGDHESKAGSSARPEFVRSGPVARSLRIALPLAALLLLAFFAAGLRPLALPATAALVALAVMVCAPPVRNSTRVFWWIGILGLLWLLITVTPLPLPNLGMQRVHYVTEMEKTLATSPAALAEDASERASAAAKPAPSDETMLWAHLSLNRSGTRRFILLFALAWGMLWLTSSLTARRRRAFLQTVLLTGTGIAVLALIGRYLIPTGNKVWWLFEMQSEVDGQPFVNRNHLASFCAMLVPLALCLTLAPRLRISESKHRSRSAKGRPETDSDRGEETEQAVEREQGADDRERRREFSAKEAKKDGSIFASRWLYAPCLVILVCSVVLTLSRGGMLAMIAGALAAASFWLRGHPALATAATGLVVTVVFAFVFWPSDNVQQRIRTLGEQDDPSPFRTQMRREAMAIWRDFPMAGAGAESFRVLYGAYRSKPGTLDPKYVENEYFQLLSDLGIVGAILAGTLLVGFLSCLYEGVSGSGRHSRQSGILGSHVWARIRSERRRKEAAAVLVSVAGGTLVVMLFHFSCDFALRIPLNAALAGALFGVGLPLPERPWPRRRQAWRSLTVPYALVLLVLTGLGMSSGLRLDHPGFLEDAPPERLFRAVSSSPTYWYPWYELARSYKNEAQEQWQRENTPAAAERIATLHDFAMQCFDQAATYNPLDYRIQYELAQTRYNMARAVTDEVRNAFRRAASLAPEKKEIWERWTAVEVESGGVDAAWTVAETAEELAPRGRAVAAWKNLLELHEEKEQLSKAYEAILNITRLEPNNFAMQRKRSRMEIRMKMSSAAALSLTKACELKPEDPELWMELGRLELKRDNDLRANEAFTKAMRIKPGLRKKVDQIWADHRREGSADGGGESLFDF